jgi:transportin-3
MSHLYHHTIDFVSRLGALFGHLTNPTLQEVECEDGTIETLVGILWLLLEKLFATSHMENASLSAAACRSLSLAIHTSGTCHTQ